MGRGSQLMIELVLHIIKDKNYFFCEIKSKNRFHSITYLKCWELRNRQCNRKKSSEENKAI